MLVPTGQDQKNLSGIRTLPALPTYSYNMSEVAITAAQSRESDSPVTSGNPTSAGTSHLSAGGSLTLVSDDLPASGNSPLKDGSQLLISDRPPTVNDNQSADESSPG